MKRQCKHFGLCGGCLFQDVPYPQQLRNKENSLKDLVEKSGFAAVEIKPINFFPEWFYRNKMEFTFYQEYDRVILGLHLRQRKRQVFDVEECLISSADTALILEKVRDFARRHNYCAYHKFHHRGFLRHLIIRETKFTHQLMLGLVTSSELNLHADDFVSAMLALPLRAKIHSLYWVINDSHGDAVIFQKTKLLYGDSFISELLEKYNFRIYIDSFFQTNSAGVKALYKHVSQYALALKDKFASPQGKVLDLYCGAGGIGLFLSSQAQFIWGVEVNKASVENAVVNARINNVTNLSFVCKDVKQFLAQDSLKGNIEFVVVNPPRCGLNAKIKSSLLKIDAAALLYSSCNPATLLSDVQDLSSGYSLVSLEPLDFFPHTAHLEVAAVLIRKTKTAAAG